MKKPKFCIACGKHHGGILHVTGNGDPMSVVKQLVIDPCRECATKLRKGYTAFHCKSLHQTLWLNPDSGLVDEMVGKVIVISMQQFNRLKGQHGNNTSKA